MNTPDIKNNAREILKSIPAGVQLVAAAKTRQAAEIREAIEGGIKIIGENYVQEAEGVFRSLGRVAEWHFIGHLQKNKVKKAVEIFDMIETVDSFPLAKEISHRCEGLNKVMPILIEINSGRETQKFGTRPKEAEELIKKISGLSNVIVSGLMTMGPATETAEDARAYFRETKKLFDDIKGIAMPGVEMKYLSMGMTLSYLAAIEEGANMIRLGAKIFGEREK